jgi:hypothetical protein
MANTINGQEFPRELLDAVFITPEQIQEEFARCPGDLAYWNAQYAEASKQAALARHRVKKLSKQLWLKYTTELRAQGGKVTDPLIEAHVENDPDLIEAELNAIEWEAEKVLQFGNVDSVRTKREMLISLGATLRTEMQHDPVVRSGMARASAQRLSSDIE